MRNQSLFQSSVFRAKVKQNEEFIPNYVMFRIKSEKEKGKNKDRYEYSKINVTPRMAKVETELTSLLQALLNL